MVILRRHEPVVTLELRVNRAIDDEVGEQIFPALARHEVLERALRAGDDVFAVGERVFV